MFILASSSPRRKELLSSLIQDFLIIPSNVDESLYPLEELSKVKGLEVAKRYPDDLILSSDTIVIMDKKIYPKPKDESEAFVFLKELSNKKHQVITRYSLICLKENIDIERSVITDVYFNELSDELIKEYIKTGSPLDKAGAYGIQDKGFNLVNKIEGSYSNVMGLPLEKLKEDLHLLKLI